MIISIFLFNYFSFLESFSVWMWPWGFTSPSYHDVVLIFCFVLVVSILKVIVICTGCPLLLWTLCFLPFIGIQSTYNKNFGNFCKAHKILNWKMSLILKIDQYLTEIWPPQCWIPYFKINISTEVFVTVTGLWMMTPKEFVLISQDKKQPIS